MHNDIYVFHGGRSLHGQYLRWYGAKWDDFNLFSTSRHYSGHGLGLMRQIHSLNVQMGPSRWNPSGFSLFELFLRLQCALIHRVVNKLDRQNMRGTMGYFTQKAINGLVQIFGSLNKNVYVWKYSQHEI